LRNQVDGLSHGLDALGIHEPVVQAVHGVILSHWTFSLQKKNYSRIMKLIKTAKFPIEQKICE
jgi:hypothetical protein